jgi:SAM-dependent methyltransferase
MSDTATPTRARPTARFSTARTYSDRPSKAAYIAAKYGPLLTTGSVLDVGCDRKHLAAHLRAGVRYVGVDVCPEADIIIDLERPPLPFENASFRTVLCADVLEHLDKAHAVFDELCRVASDSVIISLPNPMRNLLLWLADGAPGQRLKFYGLPSEPPPDRHRWFFGYEDAVGFITERAAANGFRVAQIDAEDSGLPASLTARWPGVLDRPDFTGGTIWAVIER